MGEAKQDTTPFHRIRRLAVVGGFLDGVRDAGRTRRMPAHSFAFVPQPPCGNCVGGCVGKRPWCSVMFHAVARNREFAKTPNKPRHYRTLCNNLNT